MESGLTTERADVIWIGFQDREARIKDYALKHGIRKNIIFDDKDVIAKQYGMRYGAGLVVIDKKGIVKARLPKGFSGKRLQEAFMSALDNSGAKR